jgi:copper chaperone CopZ
MAGFRTGPTLADPMKKAWLMLLPAAGAASWIFVASEGPHRTRPDHREAPASLSAPAGPGERIVNLAVDGMCCSGCAGKLHAAALAVAGVREAAVDFERASVLARTPADFDAALLEAALSFDKYSAHARP